MVVGSDAIYVAGSARDTGAAAGDTYAFVARLDKTSKTVLGRYTWDPTPQADAFHALALDGGSLYVAGMSQWDGGPSYTGAFASLQRVPAALPGATIADWLLAPDATVLWAVATDDDNGVYAAGYVGSDNGAIIRCTKSGVCPNSL